MDTEKRYGRYLQDILLGTQKAVCLDEVREKPAGKTIRLVRTRQRKKECDSGKMSLEEYVTWLKES